MIAKFLLSLLLSCHLINYCESTQTKGSVPLDSFTFDKLLSKFKFNLIKFDIQYPYGDKHDEYKKAVESLKNNEHLLIGEVGVQDYGDKDNEDLAERFNINKDDFPTLLLFKDDDLKNPITFAGDFKENAILRFVREKTGIRVVLNDCVEELDLIAEKFISSNEGRDKLMAAAKEKAATVDEKQKKSANVYVTVMQKVIERGEKFVDSERARVKNLIAGKISEAKKKEMEARLNILQSFTLQPQVKTEL